MHNRRQGHSASTKNPDLIRESSPRPSDSKWGQKETRWRGVGASWVGRAAGSPAGPVHGPRTLQAATCTSPPQRSEAFSLRPNHRTGFPQSPPPEPDWPMGERKASMSHLPPRGPATPREKKKLVPRVHGAQRGGAFPVSLRQVVTRPTRELVPHPREQRDRAGSCATFSLLPLSHRLTWRCLSRLENVQDAPLQASLADQPLVASRLKL